GDRRASSVGYDQQRPSLWTRMPVSGLWRGPQKAEFLQSSNGRRRGWGISKQGGGIPVGVWASTATLRPRPLPQGSKRKGRLLRGRPFRARAANQRLAERLRDRQRVVPERIAKRPAGRLCRIGAADIGAHADLENHALLCHRLPARSSRTRARL